MGKSRIKPSGDSESKHAHGTQVFSGWPSAVQAPPANRSSACKFVVSHPQRLTATVSMRL